LKKYFTDDIFETLYSGFTSLIANPLLLLATEQMFKEILCISDMTVMRPSKLAPQPRIPVYRVGRNYVKIRCFYSLAVI